MKRAVRYLCCGLVSVLMAGPVCAEDKKEDASDGPMILAPFYTQSEFEPPPEGTYKLPPLGVAEDASILDVTGEERSLHDLFDDKVVLMSFIYSTCTDVNGCPLATAVMYSISMKIADDPLLKDRFRMISLSFDPKTDTPEVMNLYGAGFQDEADWKFLTTRSVEHLQPILKKYSQSVIQDYDEDGEVKSSYSHILRVFLIDRQKRIRNIYSVAFLYPELIINDAKTLLLEEGPLRLAAAGETVAGLSQPGDYKGGYDSADYKTNSQAVDDRIGEAVDLMQYVVNPPLGLPPVPQPADNPITAEKVELGRKLFFDRRLSLNDTFSCAMCHVPEQGFTSNEIAMAVGLEGRSVRRNSPTIYNVAYFDRLFHDGREDSLEQQVWGPLLARNEMANPSIGAVLNKIRRIPDYDGMFEKVFGRGPTMETVGKALASYQRVLVSGDSAFDRWYYAKQESALSAAQKRGFGLFTGKAACSSCHSIGEEFALFTDNGMHNIGTGYRESMGIRPPKQKVALAPGVFVYVDHSIIDSVSEKPPTDVGQYEVTQNPFDRWKYRTPSLRNVALTAPYMHNGSLSTLEDVVRFYNDGGVSNELLDPRIRPLGLSDAEIGDLVAFLQSLTGGNVDALVADAFAAPVGDITKNDPNWAHETKLEK